MNILGTPLGWIMSFLYDIVHNYGWALIIFIVLTRVCAVSAWYQTAEKHCAYSLYPAEDQGVAKAVCKE